MALPTQALPRPGFPNSSEDARVLNCLTELQGILTAGIDASNMATAVGEDDFTSLSNASGVLLTRTVTTTGRPLLITATVLGIPASTGTAVIRRAAVALSPASAIVINSANGLRQVFSHVYYGVATGAAAFDIFYTGNVTGDATLSVTEL